MRVKQSLKMLTLSLLAAVGVMAMSASAAQANWLLLEGAGKTSVNDLSLSASVPNPGLLLVPTLALEIECDNGTGSVLVTDGTPVIGVAKVEFNSCLDNNFFETCGVRGATDAKGSEKITGEGEGQGLMTTATNLIVDAKSTEEAPFADVVYDGPECPLTEIAGEVYGDVEIEVFNPGTHTAVHNFEVIKDNLSFGKNEADLENSAGGKVTGTVTRAGSVAVSVVLTGL